MRTLISSLCAFMLTGFAMQVMANTPASEIRTQCKEEAGERKGQDLKKFVRDCTKAKRAAERPKASERQLAARAKMKACSAEFKTSGQPKKERKGFMSACMKG